MNAETEKQAAETLQTDHNLITIPPHLLPARPLSWRERRFIEYYVDADSEKTFMCATQCMYLLNPHYTRRSATVCGFRMLQRPGMRVIIAEVLRQIGFSVPVSTNMLAEIIRSKKVGQSISRTLYTPEGQVTVTERGPSYSVLLRAIELATRVEEKDGRDRDKASTEKAYHELVDRHLGRIKAKLGYKVIGRMDKGSGAEQRGR